MVYLHVFNILISDSDADGEKQPPDSTTPVRDGGAAGEASGDSKHVEVKREGERYRRGEGYERNRRRSRYLCQIL